MQRGFWRTWTDLVNSFRSIKHRFYWRFRTPANIFCEQMLSADARVTVETVSASKFPANREKNRELWVSFFFFFFFFFFFYIYLGLPIRIPYTIEQGTISGEQGILARNREFNLPKCEYSAA